MKRKTNILTYPLFWVLAFVIVNAEGQNRSGTVQNSCPESLFLTSPMNDYNTGTSSLKANNLLGSISATNKITQTANVTYQAKTISLEAGFKADNGTVFKAEIGGCTPSSQKNIFSFNFSSLSVIGFVNDNTNQIFLTVPNTTTVESLVPTILVSANATVTPESGVAQNFTSPVIYTVTAEDGSEKKYEVIVNKPLSVSSGLILNLKFTGNLNDSSPNNNTTNVATGTVNYVVDRFGNNSNAFDCQNVAIAPQVPFNNNQSSTGVTASMMLLLDNAHIGLKQQVAYLSPNPITHFFLKSYQDSLVVGFSYFYGYLLQETRSTKILGNYMNRWFRLSASLDKNIIKLYMNGQKIFEYTLLMSYENRPLYYSTFGTPYWQNGSGQRFMYDNLYGVIDDVFLYNRPLTDTEIRKL